MEKWLESTKISVELKKDFSKLSKKKQEIAFEQNIPFGTGGMRGLIGLGPNNINNITIAKATYGFGQYLSKKSTQNTVVIGYDNRNYSLEFAMTAAKVLSNLGIKVLLFDVLMATPVISYAINYYKATGGIIITASHNPKEYNGFKIYDQTGCQLLPKEIKLINEEINKIKNEFELEENEDNIIKINKNFIFQYVNELKKNLKITKNNEITFGYSPQHGAGLEASIALFKEFNFNNYQLVLEQTTYDGNFTNTKSPNPEEKESFELLEKYGKKYKLDLLFTTDPDADRLGICVLQKNEYFFLNGNQVGVILLHNFIHNQDIKENSYFVKTIVTSDLGERIATKNNIEVENVLTGFKYIGNMINTKKGNFVLGYEESFGYLQYPFVKDKDALQIMIIILQLAEKLRKNGLTLVNYLENIYKEFGYFEEKLININFQELIKIQNLYNFLRKLDFEEIISIEDFENSIHTFKENNKKIKILLEKSNVIKYNFAFGWICIRTSGTEPKLKIYLNTNGVSKNEAIKKMEFLENKIRMEILKYEANN